MSSPAAEHADDHADRLGQIERMVAGGFVLVPVPAGTKGPKTTGWNTDPALWLTSPEAVRTYLAAQPDGGVGLLHSQSGTCTLDVDSEYAALALAAVDLDLAALLDGNPYRVCGKRGEKPVWRVPDGLLLKTHALSWPDPVQKGPGGRPAPICIFELRSGAVQDMMPPSIHPEGTAYAWVGPVPQRVTDLPELPPDLLGLWDRWTALEPVMKSVCPWATRELPAPAPRVLEQLGTGTGTGGSVIDTFNSTRSLGEVLNAAGYPGSARGPWLYPGSTTGTPGVRLRPERTSRGAEVVMSWHAADPLADGKPRDAFSVWALLEHGTDVFQASPEQRRELVKKAARLLGLPEPERGDTGGKAEICAAAQALPLADWGEVTALPAVTDPVPPLPSDLLPRPLAGWIEDEARAAGLPLEMIAGPVVVGAGGLIGARLSLRNALNAPAVPPNLWGMVCGPPSTKKTHAVQVGAAGLVRAQRAEFERLDAERAGLETVRDMAAARLEALQGRIKGAAKGGRNTPDMPGEQEVTEARETLRAAEDALLPARYVVNDSTVEKLGEIMRVNIHGVTLVRDEMTAWLADFNKAGRESDRGFWLEAANGTGSHTVDRLGRGTVFMPRICAGVLGTLQPGPLADILDSQRGAGDGLLQRFQIFIWPDVYPAFDQAAQRLPLDARRRDEAARLLDALPGLNLAGLGSLHPSGDGAPLTYTPEAQAVYDGWEVEHAAAVRDMRSGEAYRAHLGKQPGTFARLALIFHGIDVIAHGGATRHPHPARVGEEAALLAAGWCEYLSTHARKLWGEGRRRDVLDAREVLHYVERRRIRDGQKLGEARAVLAEGKAGMTGPRWQAALRVLEDCGAVRVVTPPRGPKGGRPSPLLRVHPQALAALDGEGGG